MRKALMLGIIVVMALSIYLLIGCGGSSGGGEDTTAPTISNLEADDLTATGCVIGWKTNENADSKVEYGPTNALNSTPVSDAAFTKSHELSLSGLQANTKYFYKVTSTDKSGNASSSSILNFTTPATPDTTPPAQPTGLIALAGDGLVELSWTANTEQDLAGYNIYRSTGDYAQINTTLITTTSYTDNSVTNGTAYNYVVTALDDSGNESVRSDEAAATPGQTKGSINVTSVPAGATITIGDAITGQVTPYTFTGMAPATYIISVSLEGYSSSPSSIGVEVLAGQTMNAAFTLTEIVTNQTPTACFDINPTSGTTDLMFSFDAGCSYDEEDRDNLRYRWDWEDDGTWDTDWSGTDTATHQFSTGGIYTIRLEVIDSDDAIDSTTKTATVSEVLTIVGGMVRIPAGSFIMGDTFDAESESLPTRTVNLDAYWMDQHEVTNAEFAASLNWANAQRYLENSSGGTYSGGYVYVDGTAILHIGNTDCRIGYSDNNFTTESAAFETHPVVQVNWYGAAMYCNWLSQQERKTPCYNTTSWECNFSADGFRLPTEAEWEKAAAHDPLKGGDNKRRYPWGDIWDSNKCNNDQIIGQTTNVGAYPDGKSYYECYDMAGNAAEWCYDWSQDNYSGFPDPDNNPTGPATGIQRIMRGGGWINGDKYCSSAFRDLYYPTDAFKHRGFRVAKSD
jgi:formylglycine-generating enzyme required for sulfatase activity